MVNVGDRIWMGPVKVPSEGWLQRERVFADPSTAIPDHPALPAVAKWLAETPCSVALLRAMAAEGSVSWKRPENIERCRRLMDVLASLGDC